jgi:hypothetical protein
MMIAIGCTVSTIAVRGEVQARVALGEETVDWWIGRHPDTRCHDCNVVAGQLHHVGCDMEQCRRCGEQLLSCDCVV